MSSLKLISFSLKIFNSVGKNIKHGYALSGISEINQLTRRHKSSNFETEENKLNHSYSVMVDSIFNHHELANIPSINRQYVRELLDYNLSPTRYLKVPYSIVKIHDNLNANDQLPMERRDSLYMMALCCHTILSSYEVIDDILDKAFMRHNKPTWLAKTGNGRTSMMDGGLLYGIPMLVLKQFFSQHKNYQAMIELYYLQHLFSVLGERLDCTKYSMEEMTMYRWLTHVKFKISYNHTILPFKSTLLLTEIYEDEKFRAMEPILVDIGVLFQIWNDISDAFPESSEKTSTDIQEHRCTWVLVKALELCNSEQRCILEENYGKNEESCVENVLKVYEDLDLKELGKKSRIQLYNNIQQRIDALTDDYPKQALKCDLDFV